MTPGQSPWVAAFLAAIVAVGFALFVRLPLPFDYFAAVVAALLALILTFAIGLAWPAGWIWTDAERIRHAFARRHGLSDTRATLALDAITKAHRQAEVLRRAAPDFVETLQTHARAVADRLDAAAREVFYDPDALQVHRKTLVRAALIEEAVAAHLQLRRRGQQYANSAQMEESRARVAAALDALDTAFDAAETKLADRLLQQVDVASATAETLLAPRGRS
ncbi:MAG: hypothetical protein AAGF88_10130 [Pseudomonadota bacterium]